MDISYRYDEHGWSQYRMFHSRSSIFRIAGVSFQYRNPVNDLHRRVLCLNLMIVSANRSPKLETFCPDSFTTAISFLSLSNQFSLLSSPNAVPQRLRSNTQISEEDLLS